MSDPEAARESLPIVVGVSPHYSRSALRWAAAEAEHRGAPLLAVMAWRPPRPSATPAIRPPVILPESSEESQVKALAELEQGVAASLGAHRPTVQVSLRQGGTVAVLLAACAEAQLLVLETGGSSRIGAVRDQLRLPARYLRVACPVVLVPRDLAAILLGERPARGGSPLLT